MATEEVVKSIFGPTPLEIEQAQRKRVQGLYSSFGQMGGEPGIGGIIGVGLGQLANSLFNLEDPQLTKAKDMKMILNEARSELTPEQMMNPTVYFPHLINKLDAKGYEIESSQIQAVASDEIAKWNKQKLEEEKARNQLATQGLTTVERLKRLINQTKLKLQGDPNDELLLRDLADYEAALEKELQNNLSLTQQISKDYVTISDPNATKTDKENAQNRINMYHSKSTLGKEGTYIAEDGSIKTIKGGKKWTEAIAELDRQVNNYAGKIRALDVVEREIMAAMPLINNMSAGTVATGIPGVTPASKDIGGTQAFNLNQKLETIKAIIGFERLQQMREQSKTGGALGQVAVREIDFLQAVEGSLKIGQTPDQLKQSLQYVLQQYQILQEDIAKITNDARNKLAEEYGETRPDPIQLRYSRTGVSPKPSASKPDVESDLNAPQEMEEDQLLLDNIFAPKQK